MNPIVDELNELFEYKDGNLYRRNNSGCVKAGTKAGWETVCNGKKYIKLNIRHQTYYLHRIIYLMKHGVDAKCIDHIDGDSLNNNVENLREATQSQNVANSQKRKTNTSGFKGVTYRKDTKKWGSAVMVNGKHISLGSYLTKEDASDAYVKGSIRYFGEFAESANNRSQDRATQ
jgi:hypothetical protein